MVKKIDIFLMLAKEFTLLELGMIILLWVFKMSHINTLDNSTWIVIIIGIILIGSLGLEYVGLKKESFELNVLSCVFRCLYFLLLIIYLVWFGYTFLFLKIGAKNEKKTSSLRFIKYFLYLIFKKFPAKKKLLKSNKSISRNFF